MTRILMVLLALVGVQVVLALPMVHEAKPLVASANGQSISNHYIVVLDDSVSKEDVADHHVMLNNLMAFNVQDDGHSGRRNRIKQVYDIPNGFKGYAGEFDERTLAEIRKSSHVAYIEQDQIMRTQDETWRAPHRRNPHRGDPHRRDPSHDFDLQKDAPWGLSRISHRRKPDGRHYSEYPYLHEAGSNVTVMVIDTGINIKHSDFGGRARWGITIPQDDEDVDGNGHGSHCAGTIAGHKYGVAKNANVVAVKVLSSNGSGSMSDVIKGVEWAISDHKRRVKKNKHAKSVANMSLGGGSSRTLDRVVNAAVDSGVHFAVAAGNDNRNACNYSPAAAEKAITVGATTNDDSMAWFSNHGKCVDVFAPGKDIKSVWIGSNHATNIISGTSMASPHVAGLIAYYLSEYPEHDYTPKELKELVIKMSTKDKITHLPKPGPSLPPFFPPNDGDEGKTPNLLVFTGGETKNEIGEEIDFNDEIDYNDEIDNRIEEEAYRFKNALIRNIQERIAALRKDASNFGLSRFW